MTEGQDQGERSGAAPSALGDHRAARVDGILVEGLTKEYGGARVVDGISFHCPPGTITGFLGPNGSGKSTTLRMIVGFTQPTAGRTTVDGVPYVELPHPGHRVGVLLDASAQHDGRSAWETLMLIALTVGAPRQRVNELLDLVGLRSVSRRRVGALSLGMRQRLGLAAALVGRPRHLLLDEPMNGLDPEGILWMRAFLRAFARDGGTVLLSSHLLREVQAVADHVVMLDRGRVVSSGTMTQVLGEGRLQVASLDPERLRTALQGAGLPVSETVNGSTMVVDATAEQVGRVALSAGVVLTHLSKDTEGGLESRFLASTAGAFSATHPPAPSSSGAP